jgi:general secretion pathway protein C
MAKKLFWGLIFLLATLSAYLAADLISVHLKTIWDVAPTNFRTPPQGKKSSEKNGNLKQYYKIIAQRDLFQLQPGKKNGLQEKEEEEEKVAPITDLKLKLLGTMLGKGIMPFAIILDKKTKKQDLYTEGDEIGPALILKIYRQKVILEHKGVEEMLLAFDEIDSSLDASLALSEEPTDEKRSGRAKLPTKLGKKVGQNHWVLNRGDVQDVINNSSQLLTQVRIIPHFEKGNIDQPDGFQVANIRPRSFFDTMGLRNGDIIKSVNREPVDNPEKAFEAYQKFKKESQIEVVVLRNNKEVTLRYDVKD